MFCALAELSTRFAFVVFAQNRNLVCTTSRVFNQLFQRESFFFIFGAEFYVVFWLLSSSSKYAIATWICLAAFINEFLVVQFCLMVKTPVLPNTWSMFFSFCTSTQSHAFERRCQWLSIRKLRKVKTHCAQIVSMPRCARVTCFKVVIAFLGGKCLHMAITVWLYPAKQYCCCKAVDVFEVLSVLSPTCFASVVVFWYNSLFVIVLANQSSRIATRATVRCILSESGIISLCHGILLASVVYWSLLDHASTTL